MLAIARAAARRGTESTDGVTGGGGGAWQSSVSRACRGRVWLRLGGVGEEVCGVLLLCFVPWCVVGLRAVMFCTVRFCDVARRFVVQRGVL